MAPQEPVEQIIAQGPQLFHRRTDEDDYEHPSPTTIPTASPTDLRETYTAKETATCLLHPGSQHDLNMVPQMVSSSHMSKTIRLRFSCTHARRRSIGMYHQLHRRLYRVTQARKPEGKRNKRSRERHA